jgi:DNA-binding NarL/FixJ family response regulator
MATRDTGRPITILCADDHPLLREGIASVVAGEADMKFVAEAGNGEEALARFREHRPDVTLMDVQMRGANGLAAFAAIHAEFPRARVVMLTPHAGDLRALRAIRAGAAGYLHKRVLRDELVDTIRLVHAGARRIPPEVAMLLAERVANDALTERETEVLQLAAGGRSNKRIGALLAISEETVKAHMKNILAKLAANDRTHAVTIALRRGFIDVL